MKLHGAPIFICLLFFVLAVQPMFSQLQLPEIFTDHMVLQRGWPIHFWGTATPGDTVSISFYGETKNTVVQRDSSWGVNFKKRKADPSGQEIRFNTKREQIVLKDVLLGDVWLCLGQSNMEWPLANDLFIEQELADTKQGNLRFFNPSYAGMNVFNRTYNDSIIKRLDPDFFYQGSWQRSDSTTARDMSAVGYYFGKKILESEKLPIGLIDLAMGGAPLETFISRSALEADPRFSAKVHGDWIHNDHLPIAARNRGLRDTQDAQGIPTDDLGPNHAFKPGFAFSAGIGPLLNMPIKGVIWYQGECNSHEMDRVMEYADLQQLLVETYRKGWGQPKLPFYWVQLSATDTLHYKSHLWP